MPNDLGQALNYYGKLLIAERRFREAFDTLTTALPIARQAQSPHLVAFVLADLGRVEGTMGRTEQAMQHLVEARDLFEKHHVSLPVVSRTDRLIAQLSAKLRAG